MKVPKLRFKEFNEEWKFRKLKDLTEVLRCGIASTPIYVEKGVPFLSAQNVNSNGQVVLDKYSFITEEFYKKLSKNHELSKGDILYSRVGASFGNAAVFQLDGKFGVYVSLTHIRPKKVLNNYYLTSYLNSNFGKKQAKNGIFQGGGVPNLNVKIVEKFSIPLPTLPEQTKIANFLTAIDEKITQLTQKCDLLAQYKKGVMQQIFSQKLRFKDDDGRGFPEWKTKALGDVATFLDGRRKPIKESDRAKMKGHYPYYGASGVIDYVNNYIFDEDIILLGEDGENILSRNLPLAFKVSGKCWVNNHAHVIRPDDETNIDFLAQYLDNISYTKYNTGTAQPKLNQEVCKSIPLLLPILSEQTKIASFLTAIDDKITQAQAQLDAVKRYKKGLLQQLFV